MQLSFEDKQVIRDALRSRVQHFVATTETSTHMQFSFEDEQVIRDALGSRVQQFVGYLATTTAADDYVYAELWRCWRLYVRLTDSLPF